MVPPFSRTPLMRAREQPLAASVWLSFFRLLLAGALLRHQKCGQRAGVFITHVAVWLDGPGTHRLRLPPPVINPRGRHGRSNLRQGGANVALVDLRIDDVTRLASILGIEKLLSLLDLSRRIAAGRHRV